MNVMSDKIKVNAYNYEEKQQCNDVRWPCVGDGAMDQDYSYYSYFVLPNLTVV